MRKLHFTLFWLWGCTRGQHRGTVALQSPAVRTHGQRQCLAPTHRKGPTRHFRRSCGAWSVPPLGVILKTVLWPGYINNLVWSTVRSVTGRLGKCFLLCERPFPLLTTVSKPKGILSRPPGSWRQQSDFAGGKTPPTLRECGTPFRSQ